MTACVACQGKTRRTGKAGRRMKQTCRHLYCSPLMNLSTSSTSKPIHSNALRSSMITNVSVSLPPSGFPAADTSVMGFPLPFRAETIRS
jgi:hypothetical protein